MTPELLAKETHLASLLQGGPLAVAWSGGVDSSYLAAIAAEVLGGEAVMVIADSPSLPRRELAEAIELAQARGWSCEILPTDELSQADYVANKGDRCYFCKDELFRRMGEWARSKGIRRLAYGAILDDIGEHRPGARAAAEHAILAPLQDAGLSKAEIRILSAMRHLPTASKPSFACLASRLPVGETVSAAKLSQIEMAEEVLRPLGFSQWRARHHGDTCRVEIPAAEFPLLMARSAEINRRILALGYKHVSLDLGGYRSGSINGV